MNTKQREAKKPQQWRGTKEREEGEKEKIEAEDEDEGRDW